MRQLATFKKEALRIYHFLAKEIKWREKKDAANGECIDSVLVCGDLTVILAVCQSVS